MGFAKKIKKKAKKKSNPSDREWKHEGGVSFDDVPKQETRKYRRTQEKDERLRRGKLKGENTKRKRDFVRKMSSKVSFKEVVPEMNQSIISAKTPINAKKEPIIQYRSTIPLIDRLTKMVGLSPSILSQPVKSLPINKKDKLITEQPNATLESLSLNTKDNESVMDIDNGEVELTEEQVNNNPLHETDDDIVNKGNYDWFFSSNTTIKKSTSTSTSDDVDSWKKLSSIPKFDMFARIHTDMNTLPIVDHLSDIPGLHKMWRNRGSVPCTPLESFLLPSLVSYTDLFLEGRNHLNDDDILRTLLMHVAVHTVASRNKVLRHNSKLKQKKLDAITAAATTTATTTKPKKKKSSTMNADDELDPALAAAIQDQGYCRARVLLLCPFRGSVLKCVDTLQTFLGANTSITNEVKFREEYGNNDDNDDDKEEEKDKDPNANKPQDWKALFDQNIDDDFKIGIQINPGQGKGNGVDRGANMRLYSDFLQSDIIIASPLALRLIIEAEAAKTKSSSSNFLSSLEIIILHQADVLFMQNWDHVEYVLKHTNKLPENNQSEVDFTRVRPYFLDDLSRHHRQLIFSSHFNEPILQACFREHAQSVAGTVRVRYNWGDGVLNRVVSRVKQLFQAVPSCDTMESQEEMRFQYFNEHVLSPILRLEQGRTLIVTSSYFHYVRVRNELMRREADAVFVCEYSRESEISRGRSRFFHGQKKILLYSGRAHFFRRFLVRGAHHVIFYSLPSYPIFYPEIVNTLEDAEASDSMAKSSSCLVLFTPYERLLLERIVGKTRCSHMLSSKKNTFIIKYRAIFPALIHIKPINEYLQISTNSEQKGPQRVKIHDDVENEIFYGYHYNSTCSIERDASYIFRSVAKAVEVDPQHEFLLNWKWDVLH
eukprot:gene1244-2412_t